MGKSKQWKIIIILVMWLIAGVIDPFLKSNVAAAGGTCTEHGRSPGAIQQLARDSAELDWSNSGSFPSQAGSAEITTYEVFGDQTGIDRVSINGTLTVDGGLYASQSIMSLPLPSEQQIGSITAFFEEWSRCSDPPTWWVLGGLVTEFGLKWINAPGDPFHTEDSPLGAVRSNNLAAAKGALPLLLGDLRMLPDGRCLVYVVDGSSLGSDGTRTMGMVPASVWVLAPTISNWQVDAVFGGLDANIRGDGILIGK